MKNKIITLGMITALVAFMAMGKCQAQSSKEKIANIASAEIGRTFPFKYDSAIKPNKLQLELISDLSKRANELQQELSKNIYLVIGYKPDELDGEPQWDGEKFVFKLKSKNKK